MAAVAKLGEAIGGRLRSRSVFVNRKIGILTYFWTDNPGTFLQAYAMLQAVQRRFPEARVELIDIMHTRDRFKIWKRYLIPWRFVEGWQRYRICLRSKAEHFVKSERSLITTDYEEASRFIESLRYDMIIVGSDTVWEMLPIHRARNQMPIYWLPPRLKCKKAACAVSANVMTADSVDAEMRLRMAESLAAFDLVGVRDDVTWNLVRALGFKDDSRLERVPDPTFVWDIDYTDIDAYLAAKRKDLSGPVLGLNVPDAIGEPLARHYRSKGFQIVGLNHVGYADWAPWAFTPFAWAGIYKYFSAVVTERFHGTVFSLKNGTPVVTLEIKSPKYVTPGGLSKRYSVLKEFGMQDTNLINAEKMCDPDHVIAVLDRAMVGFDREAVARKAEEMRRRFNGFLDRVAGLLT